MINALKHACKSFWYCLRGRNHGYNRVLQVLQNEILYLGTTESSEHNKLRLGRAHMSLNYLRILITNKSYDKAEDLYVVFDLLVSLIKSDLRNLK